MKTSTMIVYGAVDLTAKVDSDITVSDTQTFSRLSELKKTSSPEKKYSTLEKNHFVLDGNCENMGNDIEVAWWSEEMSNNNGEFETPPTMTIDFDQVHSSLGLTLTFSEYAYCNSLKIQYYDESNELISEDTFTPDNYEYFCDGVAENYRKIVITFYSTSIPYRYLKLYKILYGKAVTFEGDNLISANILEEIDPLSNELSINTLEFTAYSDDSRFNILNPQGVYATIQKGQPLNVYKITSDGITDMGTFYIDDWENLKANEMRFRGVDLISTLGSHTFNGGIYGVINYGTGTVVPSTIKTAEDLIGEIMQSAGITSDFYTIQNELKNVNMSGYLPICTAREALQQVLFALGAVADCSRSGAINIYQVNENATPNEIDRGNIFKNSEEITRGAVVTGVSIMTHNYIKRGGNKEIYSGYVTKTSPYNTIIFDNTDKEPIDTINTITGATLVEYAPNYAIINLRNNNANGVTIERNNF